MIKRLPRRGDIVETDDGEGVVSDVATLKGEIKVKFGEGDSVRVASYKTGEYKKIGSGKPQNNDDVIIEDEENSEELAKILKEDEPVEEEKKPEKNKGYREKKKFKKNNGDRKTVINPSSDDPEAL